MEEFKNWLFARKRIESNPGTKYVDELFPHVNDDGTIELKVIGRTCLYDEIQSHAESVDINRIIQRYKNGDVDALNKRAGAYMDATKLPKTMAEMLNTVISGEKFFSELPSDIKSKFDNNFYKFMTSIGSDYFKEVFGLNPAPVVPDPVDDIKEGDVSES